MLHSDWGIIEQSRSITADGNGQELMKGESVRETEQQETGQDPIIKVCGWSTFPALPFLSVLCFLFARLFLILSHLINGRRKYTGQWSLR